jgi:putative sterol carrier protein
MVSLPATPGTYEKAPAQDIDTCTVTLTLSDADFGNLVTGKANAQRLFMSGKLKIKGDVMKATKMEPIFKKAQNNAKL